VGKISLALLRPGTVILLVEIVAVIINMQNPILLALTSTIYHQRVLMVILFTVVRYIPVGVRGSWILVGDVFGVILVPVGEGHMRLVHSLEPCVTLDRFERFSVVGTLSEFVGGGETCLIQKSCGHTLFQCVCYRGV
jgi:hypothetical protein